MAPFAANNITTWLGGYDMTGDLNSTAMPIEWEALDNTTYGPDRSARSRHGGLESVSSQVAGFVQFGEGLVDEQAVNALRGSAQVITHSPDGAEGSVAYTYQARAFTYQVFGDVGQMTPFSLSAQGVRGNGARSVGAVRGRVLTAQQDVSATGVAGTAYQLGAVASGQYLYAVLHVFAAGTTLTAVLESSAEDTFASPTTRITFGPVTDVGGLWGIRVAGPITDEYYRLRVTAVTGTFKIACVAGIK